MNITSVILLIVSLIIVSMGAAIIARERLLMVREKARRAGGPDLIRETLREFGMEGRGIDDDVS